MQARTIQLEDGALVAETRENSEVDNLLSYIKMLQADNDL